MDNLETYRANLRKVRQSLAGPRDLGYALGDGGRIISTLSARLADPFHMAFRQDSFFRHLQQTVLE